MSSRLSIQLPIPASLADFKLPIGVMSRLNLLLDKQDSGKALTDAERREADGLVELAEFLSLLKLKATKPKARAA